jgi:hypothetical protein
MVDTAKSKAGKPAGARRSTFVGKDGKKVNRRGRSDRTSAFISKKTADAFSIQVRIRDAETNECVHFKHDGNRFDSIGGVSGAAGGSGGSNPGTVKLVAGHKYFFSLGLPKACQIKSENEQGDKYVQLKKDGDEEAFPMKVEEDESQKNQRFTWTNSFVACQNKERQVIRLSFILEENEFQLSIPVLLKTYNKGDTKGLRNGKSLSCITFKMEPNIKMGYEVKEVEFLGL